MATPVTITAELLLNGAWVDISQYVYQRDPIVLSGGRQGRASKPSHAKLTLTLNNRDGRFTPNYTAGAYYPYLVRDVQMRLSVQYTSATGNFYNGFRFFGEVPEWPPLSDPTATDVYVSITASGPLRRVRQGGGKGSALTRYYATLTGTFAPVAYWPCEEDPDATIIGAGIDGGTDMTVLSGTPVWKAVSDFNGSAPVGVVNGSVWDGLTGQFGTSGDDIFTTPGTYSWVASTTTVDARVWGSGGGGNLSTSTLGAGAGGGGEFAKEASLAVTPGNTYTVVVGAGGLGGSSPTNGHNSTIVGDAVTVRGHGGTAGSGRSGGAGGTGSVNTTHHDGGAGGSSTGSGGGGGGGGGSGGTAAAGNAGSSTSTQSPGSGASAVTGGGAGGDGGNGNNNTAPKIGSVPGGGGGGAEGFHNGAAGGAGKVELIYTPTGGGTLPNANIIRFIVMVPAHGGNDGKVVLRTVTGGTIARLDCIYQKGGGGKLQLKGYSGALALLFDSGAISFNADGQPLMVSMELSTSGANVAWKFTAIQPGATSVVTTASGTVTTATIGNVTEVLVGPNGDITKTAVGHISVQYALIDVTKVSAALHGHHTEMGVDRFLRLANEEALDNATEFVERTDHWGFRDGTQSWSGTNGAVSQSTVFTSSKDQDASGVWSFTVSGTPNFTNYFILTTGQAASVAVGDRVTISTYPSLTFTVTNVGAAFGGFNNITFTPDAAAVVANPAVASSGAHSLLLTANGGGQPFANSPSGTSGIGVNPGDIISAACEVFAPVSLPNAYISIKTFNAAGTGLTETASSDIVLAANTETTMKVTATADATAAFFNIHVGDHHTDANNTLLYIDNVRVHPRMGPQTRKEYHKFLEEIEDLDAGILKEARDLHGLRYRTRIRLFNQTPSVTLDYSLAQLAIDVPAPVFDEVHVKDDITLHRRKGSKVRKTNPVLNPDSIVKKHKKVKRVIAEIDQQLGLLCQHLLNLGQVTDERYPLIAAHLCRTAVQNKMSAIAGVEIGDYVQITNLPFWYPSSTAKQLVIGYTETITPFEWTIEWNAMPEAGFEIITAPLHW